ncbi:MAG: hypothetical protein J6S67_24990 [Methanobrevibacter sp.]|nr:hypothetical protein [Methanobrevibacter sp.]
MSIAEYLEELKNTLYKINRQTWTEIKMLEKNSNADASKPAGTEQLKTLENAKGALSLVMDVLGTI